jgi:hypothetical protein
LSSVLRIFVVEHDRADASRHHPNAAFRAIVDHVCENDVDAAPKST